MGKKRSRSKEREKKRKQREKKNEIVKEFEKIEKKHWMRKFRSQRTEEEKLKDNIASKEGMQDLREKGRIRKYHQRTEKNRDEKDDWERFTRKSEEHKKMAKKSKPDIVELINEKEREEKELLRQKKENKKDENEDEDEDNWIFSAEYGEYIWVGDPEKQPIYANQDLDFTPPTEEELLLVRQQDEIWCEEIKKERKEKVKEKRKMKLEKLKDAMRIPVIPPPQSALSEYEKLRNNNIKEINQAMQEAGFFDDLNNYKKDIGLLK